jgi:hypothetical protein
MSEATKQEHGLIMSEATRQEHGLTMSVATRQVKDRVFTWKLTG